MRGTIEYRFLDLRMQAHSAIIEAIAKENCARVFVRGHATDISKR
jgi:hypothetical protein